MDEEIKIKKQKRARIFTGFLVFFTLIHLVLDTPFYFLSMFALDVDNYAMFGIFGLFIFSPIAYILSIIATFTLKKIYLGNQKQIRLIAILINLLLLIITIFHQNSVFNIDVRM